MVSAISCAAPGQDRHAEHRGIDHVEDDRFDPQRTAQRRRPAARVFRAPEESVAGRTRRTRITQDDGACGL